MNATTKPQTLASKPEPRTAQPAKGTYAVVEIPDLDVRTASGRRWVVRALLVEASGEIVTASSFPVRRDGSLGNWRGLRPERFKDGGAACRRALREVSQ